MRPSLLFSLLLALSLSTLTGCEDLELPIGNESAETADTTTDARPAAPADPAPVKPVPAKPTSAKPVPAEPPPRQKPAAPKPTAKPTAESVLAALEQKQTFQVTDQDLLPFAQVEEGLDAVTELKLKGCQLTNAGLKVIADLPALKKLDLQGARVLDTHWEALTGATGLEWLSLNESSISSATMGAVSQMSELKYLDVSGTRVTEPGFVHMSGLSSLEELNISGLNIDGSGMKHLGRKGAKAPLRILRADGKMFGALGFVHIDNFKDLEILSVGSATVTDNSLTGLGKRNHIRILNLGGNPMVSDAGLKLLTRCPDLEVLRLDGVPRISDVSFKVFGRLKKLKELRINNAACTNVAVKKFKKKHADCRVFLRNQEF